MGNVATVSDAQKAVITKAALPRALMGGTAAMRLAGKTYLPQEEGESHEGYKSRLARSTLFNAFRKTVKDMTGKVFRRPIVLKDTVPAQIVEYAENIDNAGRHINVFACDVFLDAMQTGICYILADMPPAPKRADGLPATVADEQKAGVRPYLVHIKVENLLGWKSAVINGAETLIMIRIKECINEPDGDFGETEIDQVRVLEPGKWRTFRRNPEKPDEWLPYEEGTTPLKKIALSVVYVHRTGFMTGETPLEDLADLNVAHWQSQSDQRNILHVARVPILFYSGYTEDAKLIIGAGTATFNSSPAAKLTYVEHTGAAIGAGDTDLKNLEFQMQTQGLQLLVENPSRKTATGEVLDDAKENSTLAMMAVALGDALEQALGYMAEMDGLGEDAGGEVDVNRDFGISIGVLDLQFMLDAVNAGKISIETFWDELRRRNALSDTFDPDVEKDRLASAPPPLDAGPGKGMKFGAAA